MAPAHAPISSAPDDLALEPCPASPRELAMTARLTPQTIEGVKTSLDMGKLTHIYICVYVCTCS